MFEFTCLDSNGNSIDHFTQWDVDQKIVVVLNGCDDNYLSIAPEVHFCNSKSEKALVVQSTVSNGNTITVDVPNVLLQEHYPLFVYVYLTDNINVSSQRTILQVEIPIRKRVKPDDYSYVENIERTTAQQIKKEIKNELVKEISESDIALGSLTFIDVVTSSTYKIYLFDGKLMMNAVETGEVPLESISFIDEYTGARYKIYISNGKMMME